MVKAKRPSRYERGGVKYINFKDVDVTFAEMLGESTDSINRDLAKTKLYWHNIFVKALERRKDSIIRQAYEAYFIEGEYYLHYNVMRDEFEGPLKLVKLYEGMGIFQTDSIHEYTALTKMDCKVIGIEYSPNLAVYDLSPELWKGVDPSKYGVITIPVLYIGDNEYDELLQLTSDLDEKPDFSREKKIGGTGLGVVALGMAFIPFIGTVGASLVLGVSGLLTGCVLFKGLIQEKRREKKINDLIKKLGE